jgi:hypothetical protein
MAAAREVFMVYLSLNYLLNYNFTLEYFDPTYRFLTQKLLQSTRIDYFNFIRGVQHTSFVI